MRYVILGASAAGINAAITIRTLDKDAKILIVSKDDKVYSRCMLHHIIGKKKSIEETSFIEEAFFEKHHIEWLKGKTVININTNKKQVVFGDGCPINYDKLLIATGASASIPPIKNLKESRGVFTLRNIEDAIGIDKRVENAESVVIIGAGLVGIDAAVGLLERGLKVSIVEMSDIILQLQLDKRASSRYEKLLKEHGVTIYTKTSVSEAVIGDDGFIKALKLNNGLEIPCSMAIVATGVKPSISFLNNTGIQFETGIIINDKCETSIKDIYAAGDVCGRIGIWPLAVKQGITAAYNMTGNKRILDDNFGFKNTMNFFGLETVSLGVTYAPDSSYQVRIIESDKVYKKIIHKNGIIYGAVLQGDISYCGVLAQLIKTKIDVSSISKDIFHISYADFFVVAENGEYKYNA